MKNFLTILIVFVNISILFSSIKFDDKFLILTESRGILDTENIQIENNVICYEYNNGAFAGSDTIYSICFDYKKTDFIKKSIIHNGRYFVSDKLIYDLKHQSILWSEKESIISDKTLNEGLISNLKTELYVKRSSFKLNRKIYSPNRKHYIQNNPQNCYSSNNDELVELDEIKDASSTPMNLLSSSFPEIPMIWKDNYNILYASFTKEKDFGMFSDSTYFSAQIMNVNIETKVKTIVAEIDTVYYSAGNARFVKYPDNSIDFLYYNKNNNKKFKIDFENNRLIVNTNINCGNNFFVSNSYSKIDVFYSNGLIGNLRSNYSKCITNKNFIVFKHNYPVGNILKTGVTVWHNDSKSWQDFKIDKIFDLYKYDY